MTALCELFSCVCAIERHGPSATPGVGEGLIAAGGEELAAGVREVEEAAVEVKGTCMEIELATDCSSVSLTAVNIGIILCGIEL